MSDVYLLHRIRIRLSCWARHNLSRIVDGKWALFMLVHVSTPDTIRSSFLCLLCRVLWLFLASFRARRRYFYPTQLRRFSPEFLHQATTFHHMGAASFVGQVYGLFEVHVFDGERCLKEFLIEPVESSSEQNQT